MTDLVQFSPVELVADLLRRWGAVDVAAGGVVVGPATDTQQQAGVISVVAAGLPRVERYLPLHWTRAQLRCLAPTLDLADQIAHAAQGVHGRRRTILRATSTDQRYLMHLAHVTSGPSMHYDSPETWETLLFAEVLLGTTALN